METLLQDLRYALRQLRRTPGFSALAVITLALGIGVNTAIFSMVREVVFSPRPYPDAEQVVQLYAQDKRHPGNFRLFSYPTYTDIRDQAAVKAAFSGVLAHGSAMVSIGEERGARRTAAAFVSSNYFQTLEVAPVRGRAFLPEEEAPGSAVPAVIASYLYWKKAGFDPQLVGKTIRVNERPFTVVGIAPEHFSGTAMLFGPELYFPLGDYDLLTSASQAAVTPTLERRDAYSLYVVGRRKARVTAGAAAAALQTVAANLEKALPVDQKDQTLIIRPLPRTRTSTYPTDEADISIVGTMLSVLASIVLIVACLNLANMLLARGLSRRREISVRLALGGSRHRIIRQLLTEGFVLSLAGGVGGFLGGLQSSSLLAGSLSAHMPVALFLRGGSDPAVLLAALGFCALATLLFALGPALKLARGSVLVGLTERAGQDFAPRRRPFLPRHPLVVAQIALSLGLLTAAGLFIRGAFKASSVETGFKTDHTVLVEADASLGGHDEASSLQLYRAVNDRLAALPGVQAVSVAATVPFGYVTINRPVQRAGSLSTPDSHPTSAAEGLAFNVRWNSVGADYFTTLGLPLLRGRAFSSLEANSADASPVAVVDEVLAKKLWPEGDAIGRHVQWAERGAPTAAGGGSGTMGVSDDVARGAHDPESIEIVGIVPSTRWERFGSGAGGQIYVPFAQGLRSDVFFQVRTTSGATASDPAFLDLLRREVRLAAPGVPVFTAKTFRQHLDADPQLWLVRSAAVMVSVFAGLTLVLAVVGIYGVVAYTVARRTREIGIRMALGARRGEVLGMILREGLIMTSAGVALGLLLALGMGRALIHMLYQVSPADPAVLILAPSALAATALVACLVPARRAARLQPMTALRYE
jgi:predicted permease